MKQNYPHSAVRAVCLGLALLLTLLIPQEVVPQTGLIEPLVQMALSLQMMQFLNMSRQDQPQEG